MKIYRRMNGWMGLPLMMVVAFTLLACSTKGGVDDPDPDEVTGEITVGTGSFTFNGYAPLRDKPLKIWYYRPNGSAENLPIMILLHGNSRAAESYRDRMVSHARNYGFVLIVPEFPSADFPGSRTYHQGNVLSSSDTAIDESLWTFSLIEPLFDFVKADISSQRTGYLLYGFSAGAQFVHRFNWHKPNNRAEVIVSGSAGYYSMPDWEISYPYGLRNTVVTDEMIKQGFANKVIVLVGSDDNNRSDSDLTKNEWADAQGWHRVERAHTFFEKSKARAAAVGSPFNWEFAEIPGVGHSQGAMAGPVAAYLFERK